jgi:phospholipid-binding lipoprotein MlaA
LGKRKLTNLSVESERFFVYFGIESGMSWKMKMAVWMPILAMLCFPQSTRPCLAQTLEFFKIDEPSLFFSQPEEMSPVVDSGRFAAAIAPEPTDSPDSDKGPEFEEAEESIPDPLRPWNRAIFYFNDKFYFWALKPVAQGYKVVFPQALRVCFRNFFSNLVMPVRSVNCLLQGKLKAAGNEVVRFGVNTTLGFLGFMDPAKDKFNIEKQDEDFGQTLGFWGMGPAFYIEWPILGPSSLRDSIGFAGDLVLDPRFYLSTRPVVYLFTPVELVNETSLKIGEYESLKEAAIDPYVAKRDAYYQYRKNKIKK